MCRARNARSCSGRANNATSRNTDDLRSFSNGAFVGYENDQGQPSTTQDKGQAGRECVYRKSQVCIWNPSYAAPLESDLLLQMSAGGLCTE